MKKLKLSTLFYMIGVFTFFIFFNNMDFNTSVASETLTLSSNDENVLKKDNFSLLDLIILSAFIGLVIILFKVRKETNKQISDTDLLLQPKAVFENGNGTYIIFAGERIFEAHLLDKKISVEDKELQKLIKEKE